MATIKLDGVSFSKTNNVATCYVYEFTDDLKGCLRRHLAKICHGDHLASSGLSSFTYESTLINFYDRYEKKTDDTKKGMIGELLSHALFSEYFPEFEIVSPYFNMEERSIRKGFDIVLYSRSQNDIWITEVKSGELREGEGADSAIQRFLDAGKRDLNRRLNENNNTFWLNAIYAACVAVSGCRDYKDAVLRILNEESEAALKKIAKSTDNSVLLVSTLFASLDDDCFDSCVPENNYLLLEEAALFKSAIILSVQKSTYHKIADFILCEACNA